MPLDYAIKIINKLYLRATYKKKRKRIILSVLRDWNRKFRRNWENYKEDWNSFLFLSFFMSAMGWNNLY